MNGNGNGRRYILTITVSVLATGLGTLFTLWVTVGGKYVNRDEVAQMIDMNTRRERESVASTLAVLIKGVDITTQDVKSLLREIEMIKVEQGRTSVKVDDIRARLK